MLELLMYEKIAQFILDNTKVTLENFEELLVVPKITENLHINEIDRRKKDLIDRVVTTYGFNGAICLLGAFNEDLLKLGPNHLEETYLFRFAAIDFMKRLRTYYESIMGPVVLKWLLNLQNGTFNEARFIHDCAPSITKDTEILHLSLKKHYEQGNIFLGFEDTASYLVDLSEALTTRDSLKKATIIEINNNLTKNEISIYKKVLLSTLSKYNEDYLKVVKKAVFSICTAAYQYKCPKKGTLTRNKDQMKLTLS